jgi:hypothetical protein
MHTTSTRATSRTWATVTRLGGYGENWGTLTHTVTMTRTAAGFRAEVNGQPATMQEADAILRNATRRTVTAEQLEPVPAPSIGKAAACELHRELGRLGFRDHYTTAAEVLERPVPSLAALTAEEAHTVRSYARGQWSMSA